MHLTAVLSFVGLVTAQCPYAGNAPLRKPETQDPQLGSSHFLDQFTLNDTNGYLTSDAGGPIQDSTSLKAGERGPTLLEDFIFRQKIQHFDHERVYYLPSQVMISLTSHRYRKGPFMLEVLVSVVLLGL